MLTTFDTDEYVTAALGPAGFLDREVPEPCAVRLVGRLSERERAAPVAERAGPPGSAADGAGR